MEQRARHTQEIEVCEADSDCTRASLVQRRPSFFVVFHQIHQEIGGCTANDGGFEPRCSCCGACPLLTEFSPFLIVTTMTTQHWRFIFRKKKSLIKACCRY